MEKQSKFRKLGDSIMLYKEPRGNAYDLIGGCVYSVRWDEYLEEIVFNELPNLTLPDKIYHNEEDDKFINKVLNHYNNSKDGVTGVMLSGLKGSGKTITAKQIAVTSKLPIIIVSKNLSSKRLVNLINNIYDIEVCLIFDEVDKFGSKYDDSFLLNILDGVGESGKKLILFTCNDESSINKFMVDRCSRVRYWKQFEEMNTSIIQEMLAEKLSNKDNIKPLMDFITSTFKCISFDNVYSFIVEVNENPDDTFEELFNDMNLISK